MEIPQNLKQLYKHWVDHTYNVTQQNTVSIDSLVVSNMASFASERMHIWEQKITNASPPYTQDPILLKYRFCNIYRELDAQTIQMHTQLKELESSLDLWLLNVIFNRMVCKPSTNQKVGFLTFNQEDNKKVFEKLMNLPSPKYGVAYIFPISVVSKVGLRTREEFFCFYLPKVIKQIVLVIEGFDKLSVVDALEQILPVFGVNFKFHWTEVLIDLAYQFPKYIDLYKKFPIGPGSLPTMKKLNYKEIPENVCLALVQTNMPDFRYLTFSGKKVRLSAENWEGIGCEFRKYTNLQNGNGRRRLYK